MFDIERFLLEYNVSTWTEGKNCQEGWVNITCPFCDDDANHGGFNIEKEYYNCWKCGFHSYKEILKKFSDISYKELLEEYFINFNIKKKKDSLIKKSFSFPFGTRQISERHKKYLLNRNFDPDQLEKDWFLLGTDCLGDYKFRIVIPIIFNNKIVSFQCRDITDKQVLRYKACEKEKEIIHHKNILYGLDYIQNDRCVLVEGVTDVWRIGKGAVSCFGTGYTKNQIYLLSTYAKQIFILFDSVRIAQKIAEKIGWELSLLNNTIEIITIPSSIKDPAEMSFEDALYLRKNLLKY